MASKTIQSDAIMKLIVMLMSGKKPPAVRGKMLLDVVLSKLDEPQLIHGLFTALFESFQKQNASSEAAQVKAQYEAALEELKNGPPRPATFLGDSDLTANGLGPRVEVRTLDGQLHFPMLSEEVSLAELSAGVTVFLDAQAAIVLGTNGHTPTCGPEAEFSRRLPDSDDVEVLIRDERIVLHGAKPLLDTIEAGGVKRGSRVVFCPRREVAFRVMPADTDRAHRFVDRNQIHDVIANRDIGRPHWVLPWLIRRTHILLNRPDLLERFDVRPRVSVLMTGPSGTGKTLTIRAFICEFYRMLRERTGRKDLGSRVIQVKASDLLSPWFGESDRKIDELFDDIISIASQEERAANGEWIRLPVVVILEEVEALTRQRGEFDAGVYDRVFATLLQRLDDPTADLARLPLIFIPTSNKTAMMDVAAWRRLAHKVAKFSRLDREGFTAVIGKKVKSSYPIASRNGDTTEQRRRKLINEVVASLYSPNLDKGLVEVVLADGQKINKHRRDFLTGALVEQAISETIDHLTFLADASNSEAGLSAELVLDSLHRQVDSLLDNLTARNVADYVDLPEHTKVADVRRLRHFNGHATDLIIPED